MTRIWSSREDCISNVVQARAKNPSIHRDTVVLDDVSDAVSLGGDRPETKEAQRRVPAVRRREDRAVEYMPPVVREDRRKRRLVAAPTALVSARARGGARRGGDGPFVEGDVLSFAL